MKKAIVIILALIVIGYFFNYYQKSQVITPLGKVKVTQLLVYKSKRKLQLLNKQVLLKTYTISLGKSSIGHKHFEGDEKTPEGQCIINSKNKNSAYHKNLGISYPNAMDIDFAHKHGLSAGGNIKIHGLPNKMRWAPIIGLWHHIYDWTLGCIALNNQEIDEVYLNVDIGTPIIIYP